MDTAHVETLKFRRSQAYKEFRQWWCIINCILIEYRSIEKVHHEPKSANLWAVTIQHHATSTLGSESCNRNRRI